MSRISTATKLSEDRLSVGIIGAGSIVNQVHLPTLLALEDASVVWVSDVNPQKARAVGKAFKINYCSLPEDLSSLPPADVILLATPYGVRDRYYSALRNSACALYVEKPFSRTVEHHQRICSWFPEYRLACGFQQRSWGPALLAKQIVEEKLFGRLRSIRYGFGNPGTVVRGRYHSDVQMAGGGILFEVGVHGIDALLFIASAAAAQIKAATMIMEGGFDLHTEAELSLIIGGGDRVDCQLTVSCLQETIGQLEFTFENALLVYSYPDGLSVKPLKGKGTYLVSTELPTYPTTSYQTFHEHWVRFLSGVKTQQANSTSAFQSLLTTEVIEHLYEAGAKSQLRANQ